MASLTEMLQYADYYNKVKNPAGETLKAAGEGVMGGVALKREMDKAALERYGKIVDIQEKMQKMQESQTRDRVMTNLAKSEGILPHTADEQGNARNYFNGKLGTDGLPQDATTKSKLMQVFEESTNKTAPSVNSSLQSKTGNPILDNTDHVWHMSEKGGLSVTFRPKGKGRSGGMGPSQALSINKQVNADAYKLAKMLKTDTLRKGGPGAVLGLDSQKIQLMLEPTQDEVAAQIPLARKRLMNDPAYKEALKNFNEDQAQNTDPQSLSDFLDKGEE